MSNPSKLTFHTGQLRGEDFSPLTASPHGVRETSFDDGHRVQGDSTISSWAAGWLVYSVADTITQGSCAKTGGPGPGLAHFKVRMNCLEIS